MARLLLFLVLATSSLAADITMVKLPPPGGAYLVTYSDGSVRNVPASVGNRDYTAVQAWLATAGNTPVAAEKIMSQAELQKTSAFQQIIELQQRYLAVSREKTQDTTNALLDSMLQNIQVQINQLRPLAK